MLSFQQAVRKVGRTQTKTRSDYRMMTPEQMRTSLNRPTTSAATLHATRTKPQGPLDEDPDESGYLDDVTGKPSDAKSRARRPNVRRVAGQEDATATGRSGQDDLGKIALQAKALQAADPSLTGAQAFEKAYLAPANRDLANREFRQRMARLGA
jgi:hypothetical protein